MLTTPAISWTGEPSSQLPMVGVHLRKLSGNISSIVASSPRDSEFKNDVHALFVEAKKEGVDSLSKNQLVAMYRAAKGLEALADNKEEAKFQKKFYEHCLANSDQPSKNCKSPMYHYENGVFSLK